MANNIEVCMSSLNILIIVVGAISLELLLGVPILIYLFLISHMFAAGFSTRRISDVGAVDQSTLQHRYFTTG